MHDGGALIRPTLLISGTGGDLLVGTAAAADAALLAAAGGSGDGWPSLPLPLVDIAPGERIAPISPSMVILWLQFVGWSSSLTHLRRTNERSVEENCDQARVK